MALFYFVRYNQYSVDQYLMVYDLRTLRAFPSIQVTQNTFLNYYATFRRKHRMENEIISTSKIFRAICNITV